MEVGKPVVADNKANTKMHTAKTGLAAATAADISGCSFFIKKSRAAHERLVRCTPADKRQR